MHEREYSASRMRLKGPDRLYDPDTNDRVAIGSGPDREIQ